MAGYLSSSLLKTKRKDLDQVYDDFSDFSLSSPARKIRRLDAELPPVMEEEVEMQPIVDQLVPERQAPAANEERAIVLYKPLNSPILHSPSCFSLTLDSHILSTYNKQFLQPTDQSLGIGGRGNEEENGANSGQCMAVIPWAPSQFTELMEAEEAGAATMDIECDNEGNGMALEFEGTRAGQPWQQQHCMTPQLPQNNSTPIVWYR